MRKTLRISILLGCFFLFVLNAWGQANPVTATVQLASPMSPILHDNLSDLNIPPKFSVTLLLNDANEFQLPVKFRLTIEGQGITIRTTPSFVPSPTFLDFGIPRNLSGSFFEEYFDPDNLDFQGFDKNEFINNGGRLPEGLYTMCIEVYDFFRDEVPISNTGCQIANLEEHHPANLIAPLGLYNQITFPQSVVFTWQPMHFPSFISNNVLTLYEVTDNYTDDQLVTFTAPLFTTTTNANSFLYGPTAPMLERNKEYMWRIQTSSVIGTELFKNNGYSQTGRFIYGNKLMSPPIVDGPRGTVECMAPQSINIEWRPTHQEVIPVQYVLSIYSTTDPNPIDQTTYIPVKGDADFKTVGGIGGGKKTNLFDRLRNLFNRNTEGNTTNTQTNNTETSNTQTSNSSNTTNTQTNNTESSNTQTSNASNTASTGKSSPGKGGPTSPKPELPDINDLFLLYETTTFDPNFVYGPDLPAIICGEDYYIQVQIIQTGEVASGENPNIEFDNGGFSELRAFNCDDDCFAPTIILAESVSETEIKLEWEGGLVHDAYKIGYKLLVDGADWVTLETTETSITISDLKRKSEYEVKVGGACGADGLAYSDSQTIQLESEPNPYYDCGITGDPIDLANYVPLANLVKDDIVYAGDFEVTVDEATGGSGTFTGKGHIVVPFFQLAKVNVEFSSIQINDLYYLADGHITVTGVATDILSDEMEDLLGNVISTMETIEGVLATVEEILEATTTALEESSAVDDYFSNGWTALHDIELIQQEYPYLPQGPIDNLEEAIDCFLASLGNDCQEELAQAIADLSEAMDEMFDSSVQIVFSKHQQDPLIQGVKTYGFDAKKDNMPEGIVNTYNKLTIAGEEYFVSWKALKSGVNDQVDVGLNGGGSIPSNITFEDNLQIPVGVDSENTMTLTGGPHEQVKQIYAVEKTTNAENQEEIHLAGKLNVVSYNEKPIDIVMVPVNGATYPFMNAPDGQESFKTKLQKIFDQAVVTTNVTFHPEGVTVDGFSVLDDVESGLLSNYTGQMKDIARAFKSQMENGKYYIFMVAANSNTSKLGFMPRGKSSGFVYNSSHTSEDQFVKTVAHELGHGAFVLAHIFETEGISQGTTDNLMDYSDNVEHTHLHKHQWDLIHDPAIHWALFDDDEDSEYVASDVMNYKCIDKSLYSSNIYFVDLGNKVIEVTGEYRPTAFVGLEDDNGFPKGAVSRITRTLANGDVENYYAKKLGDVLDRYYLRKENGGVDLDNHISRHISLAPPSTDFPLHNAKKYFISNNCTYKEQSAELANPNLGDVTTEVECKQCFQRIVDLSEGQIFLSGLTNKQKEDIYKFLSGKKSFTLGNNDHHNAIKAKIFVTETIKHNEVEQEMIARIASAEANNNYIIWLEVDENDEYTIANQNLPNTQPSDEIFGLKIQTLVNNYFAEISKTVGADKSPIGYAAYVIFDLLSKGIEELKIKPHVWDCGDDKYDISYAHGYGFIRPLIMPFAEINTVIISKLQTTLASSSNTQDQAISDFLLDYQGSQENIEKYEFALICGLWNGAMDILKTVPDLAIIISEPENAIEKFTKMLDEMYAYEFEDLDDPENSCSNSLRCFVVHKVWDEGLNPSIEKNRCRFAGLLGGVAFSAIAASLSGGTAASGTVNTALSKVMKVFVTIEKLTDPFSAVGSVVKLVTRKSNGVVKSVLRKSNPSDTDLIEVVGSGENVLFKFKEKGASQPTTLNKEQMGNHLLKSDANGNYLKTETGPKKYLDNFFGKFPNLISILKPADKKIVNWLESINLQNGKVKVEGSKVDGFEIKYENVKITKTNGIDIDQTELISLQHTADINMPVAATAMEIPPNQLVEVSPDGAYAVRKSDTGQPRLRVCGSCLAEGTPVYLNETKTAIEDLEANQIVTTYNESKKDTTINKVLKIFSNFTKSLKRIYSSESYLDITGKHEIYAPELNRFIPVDSLRQGMKMLSLSGLLISVDSIVELSQPTAIYDISIAHNHNYYAGDIAVLVHNSSCNIIIAKHLGEFLTPAQLKALSGKVNALPTAPIDIQKKFLDDLANADNPGLKNFLKQNLDDITPGQLDDLFAIRVKAWNILDDAGTALKTNTLALEKINFLKSKGLTDAQLLKIGQLDDIKVINIADNLAKRITPPLPQSVIDELDIIAEKAKAIEVHESDILNKLEKLSSNANYKNPEAFRANLEHGLAAMNNTANPSKGFITELDEAIRDLIDGETIALGKKNIYNNELDVVSESGQWLKECKRISSLSASKLNVRLKDIGKKFNTGSKLNLGQRDFYKNNGGLKGVVEIENPANPIFNESFGQIQTRIQNLINDTSVDSYIREGLEFSKSITIIRGADRLHFVKGIHY